MSTVSWITEANAVKQLYTVGPICQVTIFNYTKYMYITFKFKYQDTSKYHINISHSTEKNAP